jgi:hypothetical protein
VQLRRTYPGVVDRVDDALAGVVAEHTDGHDLGREPLDDVGGLLWRDLAGRCCEHEPDGVGTHGHREQRVLFARDPTDLDEHASQATDRRRTARSRYQGYQGC